MMLAYAPAASMLDRGDGLKGIDRVIVECIYPVLDERLHQPAHTTAPEQIDVDAFADAAGLTIHSP